MKVLIVNAGSSSLKYQLVDMDNEQMIVKGQVERIAIEGSHLNQKKFLFFIMKSQTGVFLFAMTKHLI